MQAYKHDCVLCRELSGSKKTNFHKIYGEQYCRKLAETKNFVLIPALGQLTEYQSMIIPKKHYISMKEAIKDFTEVQELLDYYSNFFINGESQIMVFENGNSIHTSSSCIEHAHLNILPINFNFNQEKFSFFNQNNDIQFDFDLEELYSNIQNRTYRIVGILSYGFYFEYLNQKPESQFIRKILSKLLNCTQWNWKDFKFQKSLLKVLKINKEFYEE